MQHCGTRIVVVGREHECAFARLVHGCGSADLALSCEGNSRSGVDHHGLWTHVARQIHLGVFLAGEEHLAAIRVESVVPVLVGGVPKSVLCCPGVVCHVVVAVHHLHMCRLCLARHQVGVVGAVVAFHGFDAEGVGRSRFQSRHCGFLCIGVGSGNRRVACAFLHLHHESFLIVGEVVPTEGDGLVSGRFLVGKYRSAQEGCPVLLGQAVDVVLDIGVTIGGDGHGVVGLWIGAVGVLPFVGHAVIVAVSRFGP